MDRSILSMLVGTFTLRFSTGLTGALLVYYLADLLGGSDQGSIVVGLFTATFFAAELILSPFFGILSDRLGHHRVMQWGPLFGCVAVIITAFTTDLFLLGGTRWLEGASTAASVPSILGFIAVVTANDEKLRGGVAARFEAATLAGLGVGIVAAGPAWQLFGPVSFLMNAVIYAVSLLIYRYGVDPERERQAALQPIDPATSTLSDEPLPAPTVRRHYGWRRYGQLLRSSHVWLLAPTWIAVNASLGLWTAQSIFQLVRPTGRFPDQLLMGGFQPVQISIGLGVGLLIFFAGLIYWGDRFKKYRRTTIILYGIGGGAMLVVAAVLLNHSAGLGVLVQLPAAALVVFGLFLLAGATPAALGLLADISEAFPTDRGAIMGLYSVFLAIGQIAGSLIGGVAAEAAGIDGLLVATLGLLLVALIPLVQLRGFEHRFTAAPGGPQPVVEEAGQG